MGAAVVGAVGAVLGAGEYDGGVVGVNGEGADLGVFGQAVGYGLPVWVVVGAAEHAAWAYGVALAGDADVDVGLVCVCGHGLLLSGVRLDLGGYQR